MPNKQNTLATSNQETASLHGKDHFFIDVKTASLVWMYFNEDGANGGHFVENHLRFADVIQAAQCSTNPHTFFHEQLEGRSKQFLGDLGTETFTQMKETFLGGAHSLSGLSHSTMQTLTQMAKKHLAIASHAHSQNEKPASLIHQLHQSRSDQPKQAPKQTQSKNHQQKER